MTDEAPKSKLPHSAIIFSMRVVEQGDADFDYNFPLTTIAKFYYPNIISWTDSFKFGETYFWLYSLQMNGRFGIHAEFSAEKYQHFVCAAV